MTEAVVTAPATLEELEIIKDLNPELFAQLMNRRKAELEMEETPKYIAALFKEQYTFFADPAKKKAAVCSRRAGKTEGVAAWLLDGARDCPDGLSIYIALSRNNCRLILWATLEDINRRHDLGLQFKEKDNQLMVVTTNGHRIWLAGCKDTKEIEKFRGLKVRRVAIDEAASFGDYIRALVFDVLEPALLDYNGELAIIGTPGVVPAGLFFEITTGQGLTKTAAAKWSTHSWTVLDNPFVPHAKKYLEEKLIENNWTHDNPTYQREWEGAWVRDEGALVFPFNRKINSYQQLPESDDDEWTYSLGVDIGFKDSTAFVVGAFRRHHPEMYIVEVLKKEGMIPSAVAAQIEKYQRKYKIWRTIMDEGGLGKGYAEECRQNFGINVMPADKTKKRAYLEMVKGELLSGSIKIYAPKSGALLQEMFALVWNEQHTEPDERFDCHCCDALLYLVRMMSPYYRPERIVPALTATEQMVEDSANERRLTMARQQKRMRKNMSLKKVMRSIRKP